MEEALPELDGKIPDELLLTIFSFLNAREKVAVAGVSKFWQRISRDETCWKPLIKPDFLPKLDQDKISAYELYKSNIHARIHTVYCIGNLIQVCKIPTFYDFKKKPINLTEEQLLKTLTADEEGNYAVFLNRNDAIKCALKMVEWGELKVTTPFDGIFEYPPIFTMHCTDVSALDTAPRIKIEHEKQPNQWKPLKDHEEGFPSCLQLNSSLKGPIEIFYQSGNSIKPSDFLIPVSEINHLSKISTKEKEQQTGCTMS